MPEARKTRDEEEEDQEDEDEEEDGDEDEDLEVTPRDYVMARLAAARTSAKATCDAIDEAIAIFVNPTEDPKGKERKQLMDDALQAAGAANLALESAEEVIDTVDWRELEPWDEED